MEKRSIQHLLSRSTLVVGGTIILAACQPTGNSGAESSSCPGVLGWSEGLSQYLTVDAKMPTDISVDAVDCDFNKWAWESFVWAMAEDNGVPRFMKMKNSSNLLSDAEQGTNGLLRLSSRSSQAHEGGSITEGAGAFVEADGSMLVGLNGYPVYASIHMNDSYFDTAKANLIATGGYGAPPADNDYFKVGAAVIKATWYRMDEDKDAPDGAFTTLAEVPVLKRECDRQQCWAVTTGQFETVKVALVGVHVVGYTENHPEFIWATFEHYKNAPMIDDNTFDWDASKSDPNDYTFYTANTPYSKDKVLVANQPETNTDPALLEFDDTTGKFSPVTQVVQMNKTGADDQPNGPQNIAILNEQSQKFLKGLSSPQSKFQNYNLIGSVWMEPNIYDRSNPKWKTLGAGNAVGGVKLANSTAETFMQNDETQSGSNCFECHNPASFTYGDKGGPGLKARRVAISHMVAEGTRFAVPNKMQIMPKGVLK